MHRLLIDCVFMDRVLLEGLGREELAGLVLKLWGEIECLRHENEELRRRVFEVEEKLASISLGGGSGVGPLFKPGVKRKSKRPGRREGHEGAARPLPGVIHEEKKLTLKQCPECGSGLKRVAQRERVVEDIWLAQAYNTRLTISRYYCRRCDKIVEPKPRDVVPHCRFGLTLMLYVLVLRYSMRLPYNRIAKLLSMSGIKASEGALVGAVRLLSGYLGGEYERLKEEVRALGHVHVDETGWRVNGENQWLWDFIGRKVALYSIDRHRSSEVARETLGEDFKGIVVSDCFTAYDKLPYASQKCWVHLLRDTRELESEEGQRMHRRLKRLLGDAGAAKEHGRTDVARFERRLRAIADESYSDEACAKIAKRLRKHAESWLRFLDEEELEFHNNEAERGLRGSVVMRKITGGNRSEIGAKAHEVIMSVMQTCELRGVDFFSHTQDLISGQLQMGK